MLKCVYSAVHSKIIAITTGSAFNFQTTHRLRYQFIRITWLKLMQPNTTLMQQRGVDINEYYWVDKLDSYKIIFKSNSTIYSLQND